MTFRWDPATKRAKVTIYAGVDLNGKQRQRSKTWASPNERQARREAAGHEATLRQEVEDKVARGHTVDGLVDEWQALRDPEDSPSTVRKRRGMIGRIRSDLGRVRLEDLSARHVDQWMAKLTAEGLSATTVANHWSMLRAILRQGDRWDLVTARATTQARPPRRTSNRRPTPPTAAAVAVLVESAAYDRRGRPKANADLRAAAMLGAYAGMRAGEVVALRLADIDGAVIHVTKAVVELKGGGHHVKSPKSGFPRDIDIDADLVVALAEHRAALERRAREHGAELAVDAAFLPDFRRDPAGRVERRLGWLSAAWAKHADRQGAPGVRFHDLRHWYATELLDAGVPMPVVQRLLGHLQLTTTLNVYTHAVETGGQAAAEALRRRRAPGLPPGANA